MIKKIFSWTTLLMIVVVLGLIASVLNQTVATLSSSDALTRTQRVYAPEVSQVKISNLRDVTFTVSWTTDQESNGQVKYGTDPDNLNQTAEDDRGAATNDDTHYVTISPLSASSTYYFDVVSGDTTDNNSGNHYSVTTGPVLGVPASDTVYGQVFKADTTTFAEGTIVYFTLQDNDGSGSPSRASVLSALVEDTGFWSTNLGNARSSDLSSYFSYSASGDQLLIEAEGGADGTAAQTVDTADDTPAANMTLGIVSRPSVDLSPNAAHSGDAGSTLNYTLQVTNTGNVSDTFTLSASGNSWTTNLSPASVTLNGGISTTITAEVQIPAGTLAGASDTATIMATSALSPTVSDASNLTTSANAVAGVDISPSMTQMGVVGRTVTYTLQITNTGNANDTFNLTIGDNNWAVILSEESVGPLTAGQSTTIIASVQIPADASGGMTDMATITATSSLDSSANDTTSLSTQAIAGAPGVDLSPDMGKTGLAGTTINYMLPVTNTGNVVDTFTVTISAGNSWTTTLNASSVGPLNPGQSGIVIASVSIPGNAEDGTTDMATIIATSTFSSTISDNSNLTTSASVTPQPAVDLSPDMSDSGDPGSTVSYSLQVTNTGNVADTFALSVAAGNSWTTNLSPASVTLNGGISTTITAEVQIPAGTLAGASDTATIMATSALSPTVSDASNLTTSANAVAGVDISPSMTQMGVVGRTVTYTLQITNTGNADDTFNLTIGDNNWAVILSEESVGPLTAGQSTTIIASVQIPADASGGMTNMATITATSSLDSSANDTTTLSTQTIAGAPGVDLSPDMGKTGLAGTTINYMLPVTNTGNVVDTFTVTISAGNSWTTTLNASSVGPLNPGQSGIVIASVNIPGSAQDGTTDMATIIATSTFSSTISDNSNLTTSASVTPQPAVDLSPDMSDSGDPGSTVSYSLQVTNTGNVADTFALSVAAGNSWTTTLSASTVGPLNPGEMSTVSASVSIPGNAQNGMSDTATIMATSALSSSISNSTNLTTTANGEVMISEVKISNLRDVSFTLSWITDQESNGQVQYGTDPDNLNQTADDDRGAATNDDTHHVTISSLSASTTYYFDVVSGGTTDDNSGNHYSVTTAPNLGVPTPDTVYGQVFKADTTTFAEGTIVYVTLQDNDGSGSPGSARTLSGLVEEAGYWGTNLGSARTSDLSSYFTYSASGDQLLIETQGGADGTASQIVDTADDNPAASMVLTTTAGADIQVISVDVPAEIYAGYTIPITWTVRNEGTLSTTVATWSDRIYFSSDNTLDTNTDTTLATVAHHGALTAGASYSATTTIDLPQSISGRPYLFVVSDHDDEVEEETKEGNNSTAKQIYIKTTLTSGSSGNNIGLSWPHMTHDSNGDPIEVSHYEVWRSSDPYFTPGEVGSTRLLTVTAPTSLNRTVGSSRVANSVGFTDTDVISDSNNYYYAIQAMGDSGAIESSNRAGKSTYPLTYGRYNAIALSLAGTGMSDAESLATYVNSESGTNVAQILKWDASLGTRGAFRTYEPGNPFSDNFSTATGEPYFVRLDGSGSGSLPLVGHIPSAGVTSFDLIGDADGCRYNFISLPLDQGAVANAQTLAGAIGDVSQLLSWDATLGTQGAFRTYEPGNPFSDNFSSEVGQAYFVCMQASKHWP